MDKKVSYIATFLLVMALLLMGVLYVTWRYAYTLNIYESPFVTFWSYALLAGELITFLVFTNFSLILLKAANLKKIEIDNKLQQDYCKDFFYEEKLTTFKNFCPSVDIFICTINESADMLSSTISACKNIDYPNKKVYVLDDGRRAEIKELTKLLDCNYITRDNNKGFKAGNINNALSLTNSDIVVIFDADHIAASTFLRETVYNFIDPNVALVQTPQHFCNLDAFQKNLGMGKLLANEQDMFYRVIEPGLSEYGSVFCGGTNILISREKLASVGNFPETTITEDSLLGLIFHSYGYKVVYYNRPIAIGLAASSFEEYIKQRARWAKGNLQILTNPQNWGLYKKLKPIQAFFYLSGALYFLTPIVRIIFLLAPVFFLFFDVSPVVVLFYQIFVFQICYFALKFTFIFTHCLKIKNVIFADVYDLVTSVFTIGGIMQTLFVPKFLSNFKFSVTKKTLGDEKVNYRYMAVLGIIFAILVAAELQGVYDLLYSEVYSVLAIIANLFWNGVNIAVVLFALRVVDEKPEKRLYQRVIVENETSVEDKARHSCKIEIQDTSRSGMKFTMDEKCHDTIDKEFEVDIDGEKNEAELLECKEENKKYTCKIKFKKPISLDELNKIKVRRLDKYVRFVYKKPDLWDEYFNED